MKRPFALFTLFAFSAISLAAGELLLRYWDLGEPPRGVLMFSSPNYRLDTQGAVRYFPNKRVRTATIYDGTIEYDVRFSTNNLGLIDHQDYDYETNPRKKYYAFVGDSMTAGFHGGNPWVPRLRDSVRDENIEIYNLGIGGTGIEHFYRLLKSTSTQISFTHIVIMAISGDFNRIFWYPLTTRKHLRFCPESMTRAQCIKYPHIAEIIQQDSPEAELLEMASILSKRREEFRRIRSHERGNIAMRSHLYALMIRASKNVFKIPNMEISQKRIEASLASLKGIRREFPGLPIHFVHIPQWEEVVHGRYLLENIDDEIEATGINYYPALKECEWNESMYFPRDKHPNESGYRNLSDCVQAYLFGESET